MPCDWMRPITTDDVDYMLTHEDDYGVQHKRPWLDKTSSEELECVYFANYFEFGPPDEPEVPE